MPSKGISEIRVETKVWYACMHFCVYIPLNFGEEKHEGLGCTQTLSDMATYLFVHLNVEPIGHLIVLQDRGHKTLNHLYINFLFIN